VGTQQRRGGHAAEVGALAADEAALDDRHRASGLAEPPRANLAARARADHDHVEFLRRHIRSFRKLRPRSSDAAAGGTLRGLRRDGPPAALRERGHLAGGPSRSASVPAPAERALRAASGPAGSQSGGLVVVGAAAAMALLDDDRRGGEGRRGGRRRRWSGRGNGGRRRRSRGGALHGERGLQVLLVAASVVAALALEAARLLL